MPTEQQVSSERSDSISKLQSDFKTRTAYVQAKVSTLVPSQIKGLRLKSDMPRQKDLAEAAELHQSRISMFETPGANPTVETLSAIAAALRVGLKIEFVPFSEMLAWENSFSQDTFDVTKIDDDVAFLNPATVQLAAPQPQPQTLDTSWITEQVLENLAAGAIGVMDLRDIELIKAAEGTGNEYAMVGGDQTTFVRNSFPASPSPRSQPPYMIEAYLAARFGQQQQFGDDQP